MKTKWRNDKMKRNALENIYYTVELFVVEIVLIAIINKLMSRKSNFRQNGYHVLLKIPPLSVFVT